MFQFLLRIAFLRAVLRTRVVKGAILLVLAGSVVAGAVYAYVVIHAVSQGGQSRHVHTHSSR